MTKHVQDSLADRMRKLHISEADVEESFARSRGPGGQNVNKVLTAVTLRHLPSGISVTAQDSRSQAVNRKLARERLLMKSRVFEKGSAWRKSGSVKKSGAENHRGHLH